MISISRLTELELLSFFLLLVRMGVLLSLVPFFGDKVVPVPVKILFALATSFVLFPALEARGIIQPEKALVWSSSPGLMAGAVIAEVMIGVVLGYASKLSFDALSFGSNLVGNFMGFASASTYDHHQESNTHLVGELQMALAMLLFLSLDGHHLLFRICIDSFTHIALARSEGLTAGSLSQKLIELTSHTILFAVQFSAPVALASFAVNVAFGMMARALPQLNVLSLSLSVSAMVGLVVLWAGIGESSTLTAELFEKSFEWLNQVVLILGRES